MNNKNTTSARTRVRALARGTLLVAGLATGAQLTTAAVTDLSNAPIATARSYIEPPNIMLLMDTSESMSWGHVPDALENATSDVTPIGYKAAQCNALYFNPTKKYALPKNDAGGTLPEPDFFAAYVDYYRDAYGNSSLTRESDFYGNPAHLVNLQTQFQAYTQITRKNKDPNAADAKQQAYYYTYSGSQLNADGKLDPASQACKTPDAGADTTTALGGGTWTRSKVPVDGADASAEMRRNFARWYTYYRTRMATTKSGIGLAFSTLPTAYRLGFLTMDPYAITTSAAPSTTKMADPTKFSRPARSTVDAAQFVPLAPFGESQRSTWYSKLYSQQAVGASPAREALARVGRHYANETDLINTGMPQGAITAACQQNFTIMTTDGTWNTGAESESGGPLKLNRDFSGNDRWVGQQDGDLSNPLSPRPIYDGGRGGARTTIDQMTTYSEQACNGGWFRRAVKQTVQTVIQVSKEEKQQFQRQERVYKSTFQRLETSSAVRQTVRQVKQTQTQMYQRDLQALRSTVQDIRWTEQPQSRGTQQQRRTLQTLADTKQEFQTDKQTTARITYWNKKTFQRLQTQYRQYQETKQNLRTDRRWYRTTTQTTETKIQVKKSTSQRVRRIFQTSEATSQLRRYDGATEQDFGVETCTSGGTVYCYTVTTGPTPVASCTPETKSSANGWKERTCPITSDTGWVGVQSCSEVAPTSGNNFMRTACDTVTTPAAYTASCSAAAASNTNNWTTTTCDTTTVAATKGVDTCTAGNTGAPDYIITVCGSNPTGPTPVAACVNENRGSGNGWTQTSCEDRVITATYGVQTCSAGYMADNLTRIVCSSGDVARANVNTCTPQTGSSTNGWKTIICDNVAVGSPDTPVNTCAAGSSNGLTTTCKDNNSDIPQTATCTASGKTVNNAYTQTTCTEKLVSNNGVQTCTNTAGSGADGTAANYTTTCINADVAERAVQTCTAQTGGSSNGWKTITCRTVTQTNVPVASCAVTAGTSPSWVATTKCTQNNSAWTNGSCSPVVATANNQWTTTQCQTVNSGNWTPVESCTPVTADPSTGGTGNTCQMVTTPEVAVQTCTPSAGTAANGWVTVKCRQNTTTNEPVQTCTPIPESSPNWIETTCSNADIDWRPVNSCTPQTASSTNGWKTIQCDNRTTQPSTFVSSCTAGKDPSTFVVTTCDTSRNSTNVYVESCSPQTGSLTNDWRTVTCNYPAETNYTSRPVSTCTPQTAASPGWRTVTCADNNTPPALVASCTAGTDGNLVRTQCDIDTVTAEAAVPYGTCSPVTPNAGNGYVATICRTDDMPDAPVQSCTPQAPTAANGYREIRCTDRGSAPAAVADNTCVAQTASSSNGWKQVICNSTTTTDPVMTQSCSATSGAGSAPNYYVTTCSPVAAQKIFYSVVRTSVSTVLSGTAAVGTPTTVTSNYGPYAYDDVCYTPGAPSPSPVKPALPDVAVRSDTTKAPTPPNNCDGGTAAWPCVITTPPSDSDDKGSKNSLADVAQYYYVTDLRPDLANKVASLGSGNEADTASWQHMTTFSIGLGVSGQLKYTKDYRSASSGDFQDIRSGRKLDGSEANWPVWPAPANTFSPAATLNSKGNYTNPLLYEDPRSIDDFWHAAVNGRGRYLSADDPDSVIAGVADALQAIQSTSGAGAGAATSALSPVEGDNMAYTATFTSREWTGDLQAYEINLATNELANTPRWSAKTQLNTQVGATCDNRKIMYFSAGKPNRLANFTWETKACGTDMTETGAAQTDLADELKPYFNDTTKLGELAQWPSMLNAAAGFDQRAWLAGPRLVNFLRGQRGYEGYVADTDGKIDTTKAQSDIDAQIAVARKVFRKREGVLGDIVNSQPAYVKEPTQNYQDVGYQAFRNSNKTRTPMIYVGANDGMLHAFYAPRTEDTATQGKEAWAYVPRAVMANMFRLADTEYEYEAKHRFFVDGSPVVGDIVDTTDSNAWKTLLVGGLNKGGKGYYAIDVTNPDSPKGMWEFNLQSACFDGSAGTASGDCGLGYSFGKPVITKMANGTWVVLVTSGYNNVNTGAGEPDNGGGYLYVINASTGKLMHKIATGVGNAGTPANMKDVNTYVANVALDNTALRVYGGDMQGNVWRFNINKLDGDGNPAPSVTLLGRTRTSDNEIQPITTNVELAEINGDTMVFVGTGRMLNEADLDDKSMQSVFAFKDPLTEPALPDPAIAAAQDGSLREVLKPLRIVQKTLKFKPGTRELAAEGATSYDEVDTRAVECTGQADSTCLVNGGWVLDLPDNGERVNVDMRIALNTLAFSTNVPQTEICSSGGYSWLNYLDLYTGNAVSTSPAGMISTRLNVITVGLGLLVSSDGRTRGLITGSDGKKPQPYEIPTGTPGPVGRRISWREVMQ